MNAGMLVGVFISVMIAIVVGVNLVPTILDSTDKATEEVSIEGRPVGEGEDDGTKGMEGLLDVLVYVFIAVVILGAVAWIGAQGDWPSRKRTGSVNAPGRDFLTSGVHRSGLPLPDVVQRLGFSIGAGAPKWFPLARPLGLFRKGKETVLTLRGDLTWLVLEKHPDYEMYLLTGIGKDTTQEVVYLLGRDRHTQSPYYRKLPPKYAYERIQAGIDWCEEKALQSKQSIFGRHG